MARSAASNAARALGSASDRAERRAGSRIRTADIVGGTRNCHGSTIAWFPRSSPISSCLHRMTPPNDASSPLPGSDALPRTTTADPLWYKDAIIYQLHVKAFFDADDDGIGDFEGVRRKLDYLHDLGVTALWLLPFYPSPLRDDGYDIADYKSINPSFGRMANFKAFIREAHRRNLRVITELIINHTSDQHPWFQRARRAKAGSHFRDYYVWSDTDQK